MHKILLPYFFLLIVGLPGSLASQPDPHPRTITGLILSSDTDEALPYARLSVGENKVGTLSNEEGAFRLVIPPEWTTDTLTIRHLAHEPAIFPLAQLTSDTLTIRLSSQDLALDPVEIVSISPRDTILKTWRLRDENYETQPSLIRGFYQEELSDRESDIQFLFAEGVLELYKSPYQRRQSDQVRMLKGRQKSLPQGYEIDEKVYPIPLIVQGPHLGILLDVMKADDSFSRRKNIGYYSYDYEEVIYHNGRLTYIFSFSPKNESNAYALFSGKIYVDLESLAIVRAQYSLTETGIRIFNNSHEELDLLSRAFEVNYMEYQSRWYLQDARVSSIYVFLPLNRELFSYHTFSTSEIINEEISQFPRNETIRLDDSFVEIVSTFEEGFWDEYNVIPVRE